MPGEIRRAVEQANADDAVHVIVLAGAGRAFCAGYDLKQFAEGETPLTQDMPWDPMQDYRIMKADHRRLLLDLAQLQAGDLQGARLRGRGRLGHRAVRGHRRDGRGRAHRLHAGARVGLPDDGDVGVPPGRREGEAHAADRRHDRRQDRQGVGAGLRRGARGSPRRRGRRARRAHGRRAEEPAHDAEADDQPGLREHGPRRARR